VDCCLDAVHQDSVLLFCKNCLHFITTLCRTCWLCTNRLCFTQFCLIRGTCWCSHCRLKLVGTFCVVVWHKHWRKSLVILWLTFELNNDNARNEQHDTITKCWSRWEGYILAEILKLVFGRSEWEACGVAWIFSKSAFDLRTRKTTEILRFWRLLTTLIMYKVQFLPHRKDTPY
jgi:hypothetical protein